MDTKTCSGCDRTLSLEKFTKDNRNKDGRTSLCYSCSKERKRQYRYDKPEMYREQKRRWNENNRGKYLAQKKRHRENNTEKVDAGIADWRKINRDKVNAYSKKYYDNNQESIVASRKKYKDAHRDELNEKNRKYKKEHPDKSRDYYQVRRARKFNKLVDNVERMVVFERDRGVCHICGAIVDANDWHLDHIMPLSGGGEHSYANVAVSHPSCNLQKGAGWMDE